MGPHFSAALLLGVVFHLNVLSLTNGTPAVREIDPLVVGGTAARKGEYPWIVALKIGGGFACAGTILNENWILTAGHCATKSADTYTVTAGEYDQRVEEGTEQVVTVDRIFLHEGYNPQTFQNDIALFHLAEPLSLNENVKAAEISDSSTQLESKLTVVGWGLTKGGGRGSPVLLKALISKRDHSVCKRAYRGYDPNTRICAGDTGKGSCNGDSGGPLHNPQDKRVIGVVSGGDRRCAAEGLPGFYTNIAVYADWISTNMGGSE